MNFRLQAENFWTYIARKIKGNNIGLTRLQIAFWVCCPHTIYEKTGDFPRLI
jgi:hypothetical protein